MRNGRKEIPAIVAPIQRRHASELLHILPAAVVLLACALFLAARAAYGYCFEPYPTVRCEFLNSDAVFVGTVLSVRTVPAGVKPDTSVPLAWDGLTGWVYKLSVQKMFRGPRGKTITVFTTNDDTRVMLEKGEKVLLFAYKTRQDSLISKFDTQLRIGNCGNSALASKAGKVIHELQGMKIPKDAEIEGRIEIEGRSSLSWLAYSGTRIPRVQVVVHSGNRSFRTFTEKDGLFHLSVPPGSYSAAVQQIPHWNITPFDISFNNPKHFKARKGRCARLQFIASPR